MSTKKATQFTLYYTRGNTDALLSFRVTDSAGAAVDLSGWAYSMTLDPCETPTDDTGNVFTIAGTISDTNLVTFDPANPSQTDIGGPYFYHVLRTTSVALGQRTKTVVKGTILFEAHIGANP